MKTPLPTQWYYRRHANGALARVTQKTEHPHDTFVAEIEMPGQPHWTSLVVGVEAAQRSADAASKCPQPCTCPPWSE